MNTSRPGGNSLSRRRVTLGLIAFALVSVCVVFVNLTREPGRLTKETLCYRKVLDLRSSIEQRAEQEKLERRDVVSDVNAGEPVSWRVLLLPYCDFPLLRKAYNRSQPWDAPMNATIEGSGASLYRCPALNDKQSGFHTSYLAISPEHLVKADESELDADRPFKMTEVMVIEQCRSGIHWMEPRDIPRPDRTGNIDWSSCHSQLTRTILLVDGSVRTIRADSLQLSIP